METKGKKVSPATLDRDEPRSPTELFEIARSGGEAETAMKVVGQLLIDQKEYLFSQFANSTPDLASYCKWAGQAQLILHLERTLKIKRAAGRDAVENLKQKGDRR